MSAGSDVYVVERWLMICGDNKKWNVEGWNTDAMERSGAMEPCTVNVSVTTWLSLVPRTVREVV